eukprot:gene576-1106_t
MSDDSDSEDDSDYAPENEVDEGGDSESNKIEGLKTLSHARKRKAHELWEEMQNNNKEYTSKIMGKALNNKKDKKPIKKSEKMQEFLSTVFGSDKKAIAKCVQRSNIKLDSADLKEAAKASVDKLQKKQTVTEIRKFAGQSITIERSVKSSESTVSGVAGSKPVSKSALDDVLNDLKGPKTVSTVAKSSFDWDNFKEKEGLDDELATATKEGYLKRKEFLERCDVREYVNERDARVKTAPS